MAGRGLTVSESRAEFFQGAAANSLCEIEEAIRDLPPNRAGIRIRGMPLLAQLLSAGGAIGSLVASALGKRCVPVRAILFNKSPSTNWSLGWHQDRVIAVAERVETPGFGPWTVKDGMTHVAPPFEILAAMVTLRIHLDPVPADNAPLMIAPGSHRLGRIPEPQIAEIVQRLGVVSCLAAAGDAWLYSTPILHASETAAFPERRRVLQVDYAATKLPGRLHWLGI